MSGRHVIALQFISSQISFHASTAITNKTELPIYSFKITSDDQRRLFVDIGLLKKMQHKFYFVTGGGGGCIAQKKLSCFSPISHGFKSRVQIQA